MCFEKLHYLKHCTGDKNVIKFGPRSHFQLFFDFKKYLRCLTFQILERLIISYEKQCWFSYLSTFFWLWPLVLPTHCLLCRCFPSPCLSYIPMDFKVFSVFYSFIREPVFHFHAKITHGHDFSLWLLPTHCLLCMCFPFSILILHSCESQGFFQCAVLL